MKITVTQLRQIIKEELTLKESLSYCKPRDVLSALQTLYMSADPNAGTVTIDDIADKLSVMPYIVRRLLLSDPELVRMFDVDLRDETVQLAPGASMHENEP
jgi:hypothetical protein